MGRVELLQGKPTRCWGNIRSFAEFRRRSELLKLPVKELVRRLRQVENNIWRVKSELAKGDKPHLDAIRRERLAGYDEGAGRYKSSVGMSYYFNLEELRKEMSDSRIFTRRFETMLTFKAE